MCRNWKEIFNSFFFVCTAKWSQHHVHCTLYAYGVVLSVISFSLHCKWQVNIGYPFHTHTHRGIHTHIVKMCANFEKFREKSYALHWIFIEIRFSFWFLIEFSFSKCFNKIADWKKEWKWIAHWRVDSFIKRLLDSCTLYICSNTNTRTNSTDMSRILRLFSFVAWKVFFLTSFSLAGQMYNYHVWLCVYVCELIIFFLTRCFSFHTPNEKHFGGI